MLGLRGECPSAAGGPLPAAGQRGTVCDQLTSNVDLAPTILELAGVEPIVPLHGRSIVPLCAIRPAIARTTLLTEYFLEKVSPQVPAWQVVRSDRWKYIRYFENAEWDELYDLAADPRRSGISRAIRPVGRRLPRCARNSTGCSII